MTGFIIFVHALVCILLITIILIQRGRGGGLVETFSDMESMFGTKTNAFLTRATAVLSTLFFITCLSLAFISSQQSKSLMRDISPESLMPKTEPAGEAPKTTETPAANTQTAPANPQTQTGGK